MAYSPDGRTLAVCGFDESRPYEVTARRAGGPPRKEVRYGRQVEFRDAESLEVRHALPLSHPVVNQMVFTPDGKWLTVGSWGKTIDFWPVPPPAPRAKP